MWTSCHLTSKQRFLWLPSCSFLFKTTHSLSHPNKTNVKSFKQVQIIDWCCQENSAMHFRTGNDPMAPTPPPKKKTIYNYIFFLIHIYVYSFFVKGKWKTWGGCHLQRRVFRPKTIANVSDNTAPLLQQKDCIKEKNYNTEYKSTKKHSKKS